LRLFVGLALPWEIRQRLAMMSGTGVPGARWVPIANYHLTLRFIGEVPAFRAEEVDEALAALRARRFAIELAGVGVFAKGGRETTLWVGVAKNPQLDHLAAKVETALQRAGLEPERRRFAPHVTLARLDNAPPDKLAGFVQAHNLFRAGPIEVDHFTLFSSLLGKEAAVYTPEVEYALA
jgi:RNA 2',3'-cyclic 3'-phosphodiesterase